MSTEKKEYSTILIELDCLLDTRLALLHSMDHTKIPDVMTEGYLERERDTFNNYDKKEFDDKYRKRDKLLLKEALVTPMGKMLNEFTNKTLKLMLSSPFQMQPKVILNTYPYGLNEEEANVLIEMLAFYTDYKGDIEVVRKTYDDITPSYLKENIAIYICYEYFKWLEIHSLNENFKHVTCPEVSMLGPRIYFTDESVAKSAGDPFEAMEELSATVIGLKLLPIENFSVDVG